MTLHRAKVLTISCDSCPEEFPDEYKLDQFAELQADMRAAGWRSTKREGVWTHECAYCARKHSGRLL